LCRKNPQKIEITRKLEESTVTEFEKLLTKLCIDAIQVELTAQGFEKVPETFATVQVVGPPKKKIKK
jgi:hypothetical protein